MNHKIRHKFNDKYVTKGALATALIAIFISTLCVTIITASENDTRIVELFPSLLGVIAFLSSVYLINLIKSQATKIITDLNLNRRYSYKRSSMAPAVSTLDRGFLRKQRNTIISVANKYDRIKLWYSYSRLSLTCIMRNAGVTLIFWDIVKLVLWLITLTFWRRDSLPQEWDYSLVPKILYPLHFFSISASTAEICLFIIEAKDSKDIFHSPTFWINTLILPPGVLISKWVFFDHMSYIQVYWTHGFIIWIKLFLWINNWIIATKDGPEKAKFIFRITLGIFIMSCSFAGSLYIMQGIHPLTAGNQYIHSFNQYLNFLYLAIITFSTVGYGDMTPLTVEARMCAVFYIFWMVIWIPLTINKTLQIVLAKNILIGHLNSWAGLKKFILVIGDIDPAQLSQFISKMYFTKFKCKIIVLTPSDIDIYSNQIKQAENLSISLCIMRGDIEVDGNLSILDTIQAKLANAIFVLSSFKGQDLRFNDMKTIVRTIGIKKYGCRSQNVIVQYCSPLTHSIFTKRFGLSISLNELKLSLLTKSITCPGVITLIINLTLKQYYNIGNWQEFKDLNKYLTTYQSYLSGAEKTISFHKIPSQYDGVLFDILQTLKFNNQQIQSLCETFYNINSLILIGIISADDPFSYKISPLGSEYYIKKGDTGIFIIDFDTATLKTHSGSPDLSQLNLKNDVLIKRNTILSKMIKEGEVQNGKNGSSISTLSLDNDEEDLEDEYPSEDNQFLLKSFISFSSSKQTKNESDKTMSIVVNTLSEAKSKVFKNSDLKVVTIVGYSDFVSRLLLHFTSISQFNVIIAGNKISKSLDLNFLNRFKDFLAVVDVDLMNYADILGTELNLSDFFYITSSSFQPNVENNNPDLSTIVIYRQLTNVIGTITKSNNSVSNNISGIVELENLNNVTFLDDSKWSQWNTFNQNVDSSLIYINSQQYAMGQIISDEMFYNVMAGSLSSRQNYILYNIIMDIITTDELKTNDKVIQSVKISNLDLAPGHRTFSQVFNFVLKEMKAILIGIYRMDSNSNEHYVICSPSPHFEIQTDDMGYIIGS